MSITFNQLIDICVTLVQYVLYTITYNLTFELLISQQSVNNSMTPVQMEVILATFSIGVLKCYVVIEM
jgi:hypothetical protein